MMSLRFLRLGSVVLFSSCAFACHATAEDGDVMLVQHPSSGEDESRAESPQAEPSEHPPGRDGSSPPSARGSPSDPNGREEDRDDDAKLVVGDDPCETDADCVPARCCHAAACVARANAPDCSGMMCTQECRYGTLDCGGECLCHEGKCAARLSERPEGLQRRPR